MWDFLQVMRMVEILPEKLGSTLSAWFKQVHASNASIDGNIKGKALQIFAHLDVDVCEVGGA
jgi:hypothetical protein